jgi:hypothetical protein
MLRAATGRPVVAASGGTGTSVGASLLVGPAGEATASDPGDQSPGAREAELAAYAENWRALCARG